MPMVSVCPRFPDFYVLLYKLLHKYPEYVTENSLLDRLGGLLVKQKLKDDMNARSVPSYAIYRLDSFFDTCMVEATEVETEECRFVLLLSEMADYLRFSHDKWYHGVREYIYDFVARRETPTLESLQKHYEEHYGVQVRCMGYTSTFEQLTNTFRDTHYTRCVAY